MNRLKEYPNLRIFKENVNFKKTVMQLKMDWDRFLGK